MVSQHCSRSLPGIITLRWRHNGHDSVSNHQPHDCLLDRLFRHRSKKISKLHVTGLCAGNSSGTGEFPAQMASNAENVSIWWRHQMETFDHKATSHYPKKRSAMPYGITRPQSVNTLGPRQNGRHFAEDIFKCIFLNENIWFSIKISLKFVPEGPINNIPVLVQTMAWRRQGDKPLSEPMKVSLLMHLHITQSQWVKWGLCTDSI